jgi:formate hydrogenlyase subunit 3/multisubunit Na+/H+ antiporter MnhD subunit
VTGWLPTIVVALPFLSAAVLAVTGSWRIGAWINGGSAGLQFVVACALTYRVGGSATNFVLLAAFVAMTTSWSGQRDIAAALAAGSLSPWRVRLYHVGFQGVLGAVQAAALSAGQLPTWFAAVVGVAAAIALVRAMHDEAAPVAAARLALHCSIGLLLALLGMLLLGGSGAGGGVFILVGFGALAGLVPLHAWLPAAVAVSLAPGAVMLALLADVPLLVFLQLDVDRWMLIGFGLLSLMTVSVTLLAPVDRLRGVALAAVAQLGIAVFAIGVGAKQAAWQHVALLALARSAVLQSQDSDLLAWMVFALLPLYALSLVAGSAASVAAWLLAPLGAGVLLLVWVLLQRRPSGMVTGWHEAAPVWLQLAVFALLAFVLPLRAVIE